MDEHRVGLKPLLRRVWAPIGQRPVAIVQHRFAWRYVVGFVHPASGRTFFHLATSVSIPLFEAELAAFARAAGASPTQADRTGPGPGRMAYQSAVCRCPSTCICCSCRRIRPNSNRPSICGRSPIRCSSTGISPPSMSWRRCSWHTVRRCSTSRRRSARPPVFTGGPGRFINGEDPHGRYYNQRPPRR